MTEYPVDEQEGSIRPGAQPGSDGVRLSRDRIFAKKSDQQVDPDGFTSRRGDLFEIPHGGPPDLDGLARGKGDLFAPKPAGPPDRVDREQGHGNPHDVAPGNHAGHTASLAAEDDDDLYQMAEEVFSSLTLDDWAVIQNDNDPFDNRDPFRGGVKWVPGLGPPPASP